MTSEMLRKILCPPSSNECELQWGPQTHTVSVGIGLQSCGIFPLRVPAGKCEIYYFSKAAPFAKAN